MWSGCTVTALLSISALAPGGPGQGQNGALRFDFGPGAVAEKVQTAAGRFEKIGSRSPAGIRTGTWQVDDPIGTTWGYTSDMRVAGAGSIVSRLCDTVSKNGNLLLNLSPQADGTIPQEQQNTLLEVGQWLQVNGDAIYGTHAWTKFGEGGRGQAGLNIRFTVKGDDLYAIILGDWPGEQAVVTSLATGQAPQGKITAVSMLGNSGNLEFTQNADGLKAKPPSSAPCKYGCAIKITGPKMNPPMATESGNPQ